LGHAVALQAQAVSLAWKCAHARGVDVVCENSIRYPSRTTANAATPIRTPSVFRIMSLMSTARDGKATVRSPTASSLAVAVAVASPRGAADASS